MAYRNERYFVDGNTVRKIQATPERMPEREKKVVKRPEKKQNKRIAKNASRARAFDLRYTTVLVVATLCLFASCVSMLNAQSRIAEQRKSIEVLETKLTTLAEANDETAKRLDSSVDLTHIYNVATKQLGMTYPKMGQIINYEESNPDYVKQYMDVPTR